jgi:DNA-binding LacI/PurR family transcriptional regulator
MGKMAAEMVIQMVRGVMPDESLFILDTQLVIRESCTRLQ